MDESDTYLAILDEGQEKAWREAILRVGEKRLGPPDDASRAGFRTITDLPRLKRMIDRTVDAASWQEVLDTQ
jgi:hypothetical protein